MSTQRKPSWGFYLAVVPVALFAADMVYENTLLSWQAGPQMTGFALLHTVGILLLPAILVSLIWGASTVLAPLYTKRWNLGNIGGALLIVVLLGIANLPYGFWIKTFADRVASGPYAADFLVHMAALGDIAAVEALLNHGVPINSSDRSGIRAIVAAENANQPAIREYLAQRGARYARDEQ